MDPEAAPAAQRVWTPQWPCPVPRILGQQRRGAGDPSHRVDESGAIWRAMRTPVGAASLRIVSVADGVEASAWGEGADWALEQVPALLGADDDPTDFVALHDAVATGLRQAPHWRLGASGLVMEALVPTILEQKVTGKQAFGSFRELLRRHGEPAPGPVGEIRLRLQPTPQQIAQIPSWEWLKLGVQPAQSRALVSACRVASSLERAAARGAEDLDRALCSLPGVGVWTSAEVRQRALGDIDAVSFGDYHLANHVGWALLGHDITDDEMATLLEPYRPQRGRAAAMALAGGQARPRRGPRMSIPTHLPTR